MLYTIAVVLLVLWLLGLVPPTHRRLMHVRLLIAIVESCLNHQRAKTRLTLLEPYQINDTPPS